MFYEAICDNLGTIIGVIGSLLGAFVGWWLNNLSKRGKLTAFVDAGINGDFVTEDYVSATCLDKAKEFHYRFNIEVYNSSSDTKIMRDIKIVFYKNSKVEFSTVPYDKDLMVSGRAAPIHKPAKFFNIPPKTVIKTELYGYLSQELFNKIMETNSVFLLYRDERNKEQKMLVEAFDYSNYEFYQGE